MAFEGVKIPALLIILTGVGLVKGEKWLLNISHNNISKIADYASFNLNQLRVLDISNNAIVNLPVHVFQGLICFKEDFYHAQMYLFNR